MTLIDETPLYLPLDAAAARSGLDSETLRGLTAGCPALGERPPVESRIGRSGRLLVNILDVRTIADGLVDSGLMTPFDSGA